MNLVIPPRAQAQIDHQIAFGTARYGTSTARMTFARVEDFFINVIAVYPASGRLIDAPELYERYIPRTPFVVIYRIEINTVRILGFFHHAQDRGDFEPED